MLQKLLYGGKSVYVETLSLGPLGTNCYIISKDQQALIIDPGGDADKVKHYLEEHNLMPLAILLTHAHFDHIGAVHELRTSLNLDVYLHQNEANWIEEPELNRSILFLGTSGAIKTIPPEHILQEGTLQIGTFNFEVVHTPGHSPGSVTFIFHDEGFIVSGDVLFHQGIGRTDIPEGSITVLAESISKHLYTLPEHFVVYPGHGVKTTIGEEMYTNPYTLAFYKQ